MYNFIFSHSFMSKLDPRHSAQDITRCDLCDATVPPMHCDICHINLCKDCVVDHLSDESKDHKVVSFNKRGSTVNYPKCHKHSLKICELHCRHCFVPICIFCVSSGEDFSRRFLHFVNVSFYVVIISFKKRARTFI